MTTYAHEVVVDDEAFIVKPCLLRCYCYSAREIQISLEILKYFFVLLLLSTARVKLAINTLVGKSQSLAKQQYLVFRQK